MHACWRPVQCGTLGQPRPVCQSLSFMKNHQQPAAGAISRHAPQLTMRWETDNIGIVCLQSTAQHNSLACANKDPWRGCG